MNFKVVYIYLKEGLKNENIFFKIDVDNFVNRNENVYC